MRGGIYCLIVMLGVGIFCVVASEIMLILYNRLFGLLYRHVSEECAEPVSFWIVMLLPLGSVWGWITYSCINILIT